MKTNGRLPARQCIAGEIKAVRNGNLLQSLNHQERTNRDLSLRGLADPTRGGSRGGSRDGTLDGTKGDAQDGLANPTRVRSANPFGLNPFCKLLRNHRGVVRCTGMAQVASVGKHLHDEPVFP